MGLKSVISASVLFGAANKQKVEFLPFIEIRGRRLVTPFDIIILMFAKKAHHYREGFEIYTFLSVTKACFH